MRDLTDDNAKLSLEADNLAAENERLRDQN